MEVWYGFLCHSTKGSFFLNIKIIDHFTSFFRARVKKTNHFSGLIKRSIKNINLLQRQIYSTRSIYVSKVSKIFLSDLFSS